MLCIKCNSETPDTEMYCRNCGTKLDFTFDQIQGSFAKDIQSEKAEETEELFRWLLTISIALLVIAIFFKSLWTRPPEVDMVPGYIPDYKINDKMPNIYQPIILKEVKKEKKQ